MSNPDHHPEIAIRTSWFATDVCAVCAGEWEPNPANPVPTAYTVESIKSDNPPEPVCDYCIEKHYPETSAELLAERQRFYQLPPLMSRRA